MKKILFLILAFLFFFGLLHDANAEWRMQMTPLDDRPEVAIRIDSLGIYYWDDSGFFQHDSMYADWDHLVFSWFGYKNPQPIDVMRSRLFNWWGKEPGAK
ncbi:MAG: hypothetical protein PHG91_14220 [Syntrophales bacterium]|nr:hypothetical protein [Syntrophales bacterium]